MSRTTTPEPAGFGRVPLAAVLSHDLARAASSTTGRPVSLDDLEMADRIAALLVERWEPRRRQS